MIVTIQTGNILAADAQTLTNPVNCVGVMGKGLALEFKKRFPEMYPDYVMRCRLGQVKPGEPYLYRSSRHELGGSSSSNAWPWILNFPTKRHWRDRSNLQDIVDGLTCLERHYAEWRIQSLAVPPLGCGNGGLDWAAVRPILLERFSRFTIPVVLCVPPEMEDSDGMLLSKR